MDFLPSPCLNVPTELHNSALSQWKNKVQTSQSSPRVSLICILMPCPLCRVRVTRAAGGRRWSGCLQGEVALLSTVVLTSTETCQAHSLGLGQGPTLQERWVLQRPKKRNESNQTKKTSSETWKVLLCCAVRMVLCTLKACKISGQARGLQWVTMLCTRSQCKTRACSINWGHGNGI